MNLEIAQSAHSRNKAIKISVTTLHEWKETIDVYLREREAPRAGVTDEMAHLAEHTRCSALGVRIPEWEIHAGNRYRAMRAALEAVAPMLASARVTDGWQLVPIEPTHAMCGAPDVVWHPEAKRIYQQMLATAPKRGEG